MPTINRTNNYNDYITRIRSAGNRFMHRTTDHNISGALNNNRMNNLTNRVATPPHHYYTSSGSSSASTSTSINIIQISELTPEQQEIYTTFFNKIRILDIFTTYYKNKLSSSYINNIIKKIEMVMDFINSNKSNKEVLDSLMQIMQTSEDNCQDHVAIGLMQLYIMASTKNEKKKTIKLAIIDIIKVAILNILQSNYNIGNISTDDVELILNLLFRIKTPKFDLCFTNVKQFTYASSNRNKIDLPIIMEYINDQLLGIENFILLKIGANENLCKTELSPKDLAAMQQELQKLENDADKILTDESINSITDKSIRDKAINDRYTRIANEKDDISIKYAAKIIKPSEILEKVKAYTTMLDNA